MIPSISYPEAMAKVRVITLQDQLKRTVKTLQKAGTFYIGISEELNSVDCTSPEKELLTTDNLLTPIDTFLCSVQTIEQADSGDGVKLIYTGPFIEFGQDGSIAGEGS